MSRRYRYCNCGQRHIFEYKMRQHIASQTPRWPAQRCSVEHHDVSNELDLEYVQYIKTNGDNGG